MTSRARVLFVDDEPHLLAGLRRSLHTRGVGWQISFAASGAEALDLMTAEPCDAVISDMRMPGMDGAQLLDRIRRAHPGTARFVLSGEADRDAVLASASVAHQFFDKPCDVENIIAVVDRVLTLRSSLDDPGLRDLLGGIGPLPMLPATHAALTAAVACIDAADQTAPRILATDIAGCAEVLRLTNSAFFGVPRRFATMAEAVSLLGPETLRALVTSGAVVREVAPGGEPELESLNHRARQRVEAVQRIAHEQQWPDAETARTALAALLLEIGTLALASGEEPLGPTDHPPGQLSAYLLTLWGFGEDVVSLVAGFDIEPGTEADLDSAAQALRTADRTLHPEPVEEVV